MLSEVKHKNFKVCGFHGETNTGHFIISLCFKMQFFVFDTFTADKQHCAWPRLLASAAIVLVTNGKRTVLQCTRNPSFGKAAEAKWRSLDVSKYI